MKLKLSVSLFLLIGVFPAVMMAQSGPSPKLKTAQVASGNDMGGLIGDLAAVLNSAMEDDEVVVPATRPRIVNRQRPVTVVRSAPASVSPARTSAEQVERDIFHLINKQRAAQGLEALIWNDEVAKIARMHSRNMADHRFFSHRGIDGKMVNDRADSVGLSKWRGIGENIAFERGYDHPAAFAVEKWMESPSHRKNLLGQTWRESAVGVAVAPDGSYYFTQVFLQRK
jgi:uncharacterized protein YkwD